MTKKSGTVHASRHSYTCASGTFYLPRRKSRPSYLLRPTRTVTTRNPRRQPLGVTQALIPLLPNRAPTKTPKTCPQPLLKAPQALLIEKASTSVGTSMGSETPYQSRVIRSLGFKIYPVLPEASSGMVIGDTGPTRGLGSKLCSWGRGLSQTERRVSQPQGRV